MKDVTILELLIFLCDILNLCNVTLRHGRTMGLIMSDQSMAVAQWRQMPHFWNGKCNLLKANKKKKIKICLNSPPLGLAHFIQTRATAVQSKDFCQLRTIAFRSTRLKDLLTISVRQHDPFSGWSVMVWVKISLCSRTNFAFVDGTSNCQKQRFTFSPSC